MPFAVLDLDLAQLPAELTGLERYPAALALVRLKGVPVGRAWLPLAAGHMDGATLRTQLVAACGPELWASWLRIELGLREVPPAPPATILITTRDRPDDLRRCLTSLLALPDDGQEILVIDNAPGDDATARVVADFPHVRYLREDRPGVNRARNTGIAASQHDFVAFIDDDAVADPLWLRTILRNFADPQVFCVTGLVMPLELEHEGQEVFERYAVGTRGFRRRSFDCTHVWPLETAPIGASVNMALRRSARWLVGEFDEAHGPGTPTRSGSETEYYIRLLSAGYRILYEPEALVWHRHRITWAQTRQTLANYALGKYAILTRELLANHDLSALWMVWQWFRWVQFPRLYAGLRGRSDRPLIMTLDELRGWIKGPYAFFVARRQLRKRGAR
jgi:GT2 family glycosyltransferase